MHSRHSPLWQMHCHKLYRNIWQSLDLANMVRATVWLQFVYQRIFAGLNLSLCSQQQLLEKYLKLFHQISAIELVTLTRVFFSIVAIVTSLNRCVFIHYQRVGKDDDIYNWNRTECFNLAKTWTSCCRVIIVHHHFHS